jgi:hypothetical protein
VGDVSYQAKTVLVSLKAKDTDGFASASWIEELRMIRRLDVTREAVIAEVYDDLSLLAIGVNDAERVFVEVR